MTQDEQNLDLLGVFHYVLGGITAFASCIPFIHLALGIAMLLGKLDGKDAPPAFIGWILVLFASLFILSGWTLAALMLLAGGRLKRRRSHRFCFIVACVECLLMPLGTVLGVFTIIHLNKESVQRLFVNSEI
jgi:hypothetical protein